MHGVVRRGGRKGRLMGVLLLSRGVKGKTPVDETAAAGSTKTYSGLWMLVRDTAVWRRTMRENRVAGCFLQRSTATVVVNC